KHENIEDQRDRIPIDRFECNGQIKIILNLRLNSASIHLQHLILHKRPERFGVNKIIKEEIKKNLYLNPKYVHDNNDQLNSAKIFLHESGYKIVLSSSIEPIRYLGFTTPFFEKLMKNKEIIVDSTFKTNALGFELYSIICQFNGSGFAMAYLFVEGKNKKDNKDYTQISAVRRVWTNAKIQICLWHIKRALKKRLTDNTPPKIINY
ncbi:24222_t:CDS:2, partial [Gigaspora rosea]